MVHARVLVPIAAMAALAVVEVAAMHYGHDGVILFLTVGSIAGLGGFSLGRLTAPWEHKANNGGS